MMNSAIFRQLTRRSDAQSHSVLDVAGSEAACSLQFVLVAKVDRRQGEREEVERLLGLLLFCALDQDSAVAIDPVAVDAPVVLRFNRAQ